MKRPSALAALRVLAVVILGATIMTGLMSSRRAVARVESRALGNETDIAAQIAREMGSAGLDRLFPGRWSLDDETPPGLEGAVVTANGGRLVGRAVVYDADRWNPVGSVTLQGSPDLETRLPLYVWLSALVALGGVGLLVPRWARPGSSSSTGRLALAATGVLVSLAVMIGGGWAHARLADATPRRMDVAVTALNVLGADEVSRRPGGVFQLTGVPYVLQGRDGDVTFSHLSTAAAEDLRNVSPTGVTVRGDGAPYLVADVGSVRLALLTDEHTDSPAVGLAVILMVGLTVAWAIGRLTALGDQPRVLRRNLVAWSFLGPSALHLAVFTVGPLAWAGWLSLHRWSLIDDARPFVGIANYLAVLSDGSWWRAVANTAFFTLHVPFAMAVALALALLVHRRARGVMFLRAVFFLPSITSMVAIAIVWQWMFHQEFGIINWALGLVGIPALRWLNSPATAMLAIMIMSVWLVVGYQMVLFLAGLSAIPRELYDAAKIDGASPWRRLWHVTLPGLRHTLVFVLITSVIGSFQVFAAVYVMTQGGPLQATNVAVFHIYREAWELFRFGSAAAMSWVLFAIVFVVTWTQFRMVERRAKGLG